MTLSYASHPTPLANLLSKKTYSRSPSRLVDVLLHPCANLFLQVQRVAGGGDRTNWSESIGYDAISLRSFNSWSVQASFSKCRLTIPSARRGKLLFRLHYSYSVLSRNLSGCSCGRLGNLAGSKLELGRQAIRARSLHGLFALDMWLQASQTTNICKGHGNRSSGY
jgi:hypothetical protein